MLLSDDVSRLIHSWSVVYFLMISARVSDFPSGPRREGRCAVNH
jgi:hypothetical protein